MSYKRTYTTTDTYTTMLYPYPPSLFPYLLYSKQPAVGTQRVIDKSVEDYYAWGNLKKRLASDVAANSLSNSAGSDSAGNALANAALVYGTLTVGEKVGKWYRNKLQQFTDKHPRFEEFRNAHPILGNVVAWTPGIGITATGALAAATLGRRFLRTPVITGLLRNPLFQKVGILVVGAGLLLTSFWGILAKNGLKSVGDSGREYRAMRKQYPELSPKQLKQLVTAKRNQVYMDAYEAERQSMQEAALNPFYGVKPYQLLPQDQAKLGIMGSTPQQKLGTNTLNLSDPARFAPLISYTGG